MSVVRRLKNRLRPAWHWVRSRAFGWRPGCVDSLVRVNDSLMILDGWSAAEIGNGPIQIRFGAGPWSPAVAVRFDRADVSHFPGGRGLTVMTRPPSESPSLPDDTIIRLRTDNSGRGLQWPMYGNPLAADLVERLRSRVSSHASFAGSFASVAPAVSVTLGSEADRATARIDAREVSDRTVIPPVVARADDGRNDNVALDFAFAFAGGLMAIGWARSDNPSATLRLSGNGAHPPQHLIRYPRPDIDSVYGDSASARAGFIAWFENAATRKGVASSIELVAGGKALRASAPVVASPDLAAARTAFVDVAPEEMFRDADQAERLLHPFFSRISEQARQRPHTCTVSDVGSPHRSPRLSVIIPVYRQLGLMEHQVVQFARDPGLREQAEILFVLDSPEQSEEFLSTARTLHAIYGLDFRVGIMDANAGYAGVNNAAVRVCRGTRLCLLNSDVFPDTPGWLNSLDAVLTAHAPEVAAVGPKLLYEDDSIQHAGMFFRQPEDHESWFNDHYYKGFHRHFAGANESRLVPAVTGACLVMDRDRYEAIGGFTESYILGDCEDSDLCLKLHAAGHRVWYEASVELYHLEGQSYPSHRRRKLVYYNHWLQTARWKNEIADVLARHPGNP